jgi:hypothetical protein
MKDLVAMLDEHIAHREAELGNLRRAREILAAHQGESPAPGSTGGEPAPHRDRGKVQGARARRDAAEAGAARSPRPVAAVKGGPPPLAARANGKGAVQADKHCTRCGKTKPASAFQLRSSGRLASWCRECYRDYFRAKRAATKIGDRDVKPAKSKPATAQKTTSAPPPLPAGRAPAETPAQRLARLKERAQATKVTERASRVPVRCKLPGADGKPCGVVVMSNRATLHAYQEHKKNVPIETMGQYFERAPNGAEAA